MLLVYVQSSDYIIGECDIGTALINGDLTILPIDIDNIIIDQIFDPSKFVNYFLSIYLQIFINLN